MTTILHEEENNDIAIIGISCRFPKAVDAKTFIKHVLGTEDCISHFDPHTEKELLSFEKNSKGKYIPASAIIDNIEYFDAAFFGVSPLEAKITDPQQRLLLECTWEALEDSGEIAKREKNKIGVYTCTGKNTYLLANTLKNKEACNNMGIYQLMMGNYNDFASTRISYKLGLTGPSLSLQSACSSSVVALHYACQDLNMGYCDMAILGASSIRCPQHIGYMYEESGIFSANGKCLPFDDRANGTVPGNGVGVIVLKKLSDARKDNNSIYAIIKAVSVNNDGKEKAGYTAPGISGQKNVISDCLKRAGVNAQEIGYLETHGTGTRIGDPIEFEAAKQAYKSTDTQYCAIGSVKWQIGHLDVAAGLAGIIKSALCLKHKIIPGSPYLGKVNKYINLENSPFYIPQNNRAWEIAENRKRMAAVSSFGLGGTNGHVILQEYSSEEEEYQTTEPVILPVSAKTEDAINGLVAKYIAYLSSETVNLGDIAYTLWNGRLHFKEYRTYIVCDTKETALEKLRKINIETPKNIKKIIIDFSHKPDKIDYDSQQMPESLRDRFNYWKTHLLQNDYKNENIAHMLFLASLFEYLKQVGCNVMAIHAGDLSAQIPDPLFTDHMNAIIEKKDLGSPEKIGKDSIVITNNYACGEAIAYSIADILKMGGCEFLGRIWASGLEMNLYSQNNGLKPKHIHSFPTYPFQRKKYWIESDEVREGKEQETAGGKTVLTNTDNVNETVLKLWEEIIGISNLKLTDDFFSIGGDSLAAVRFLTQVNALYKIKISMDSFTQMLSAQEVVDYILARRNKPSEDQYTIKLFNDEAVHLLKKGDNSFPVILFHPAGGTTFCYMELLRDIDIQSSVFGVQFPLELLKYPVKKIPQLASYYLGMLKNKINASGYYLAGYSLGGNLALEIATLMQKENIDVKGLFLIDSHAPKAYEKEILDRQSIIKSFPFILKSYLHIETNDNDAEIDSIEELYDDLKGANPILNDISKEQFIQLFNVWKYNHLSLRAYEHETKYNGDIIIFEAIEQESQELLDMMGMQRVKKSEWERYTNGRLFIRYIPGNHYTLLSSPHAQVLCKEINSLFSKE